MAAVQRTNEIQPEQSSALCPEVAGFFTGCRDGNRYTVHEIIGKGSYGLVCSATDKLTNQRVAIKKIQNVFDNTADATRILREITLLRLLKHIDVVEMNHILLPTDPTAYKDIYLVFELFESDLHAVIGANDDLTQDHFKVFLYQLVRGLAYIHHAGVLHRDLKPKNILANSNCKLKFCDFGLARCLVPESGKSNTPVYWTDYVATRWYRAPELCGCFYGRYSQAVDIWSLGCIFAEILQGKPLFPGRNVVSQLNIITDLLGKPSFETIERISNQKARDFLHKMPHKAGVPLESKFPKAVDPLAIDLLKKMLAFDPAERPTAADALNHPYFKGLPSVRLQDMPTINKDNFDFEQCHLTEKDVRELIYIEVLHYHPRHQAVGADLMSMLIDQHGRYPPSSPFVSPAPQQLHQQHLLQQMQQRQQLVQPSHPQHVAYGADPTAAYLQHEILHMQQVMYQQHLELNPEAAAQVARQPDSTYTSAQQQQTHSSSMFGGSPTVGTYMSSKLLTA